MEVQARIGVVPAPAGVPVLPARSPDFGDIVGQSALGTGHTEVQANAPIEQCQIFVGILIAIERRQPYEPAAVQQLMIDRLQLFLQAGEREVLDAKRQHIG